jgi:hypothetical protein
MLSYLKLSENYLEVDVNCETVLRIRLNGKFTSVTDESKIEYVGPGLRIIVDKADTQFEIRTDNISFNVSYVDFLQMPEMLAGIVDNYNEYLEEMNSECDYCHGAIGICGGRCRDRD